MVGRPAGVYPADVYPADVYPADVYDELALAALHECTPSHWHVIALHRILSPPNSSSTK
jgi:hypothetical protein